MKINLIPVCQPGVSYGEEMLKEAISRFREQLLAVIVVCSKQGFAFDGEEVSPDNIKRADIQAAICLFREIGTIGQITSFIHEDGMNINLSGTGGWYGKDFMVHLTQHNVKPWFYPLESAYELMAEWSGKLDDFSDRRFINS